ncbi:MAG TPA: diacylglycerol kinase family protein [Candidatus Sulfotelmatobacter sp.]|nr:diacylglycerol kinase family protein [Candidatus Sulfotelmatobacter sp.]
MMRKAALLYNPDSGGRQARRLAELESALKVLRGGGVEAELVLSHSREDAGEHTRQAIASGCDTIFACGGDGTIHNVVQAMAGTTAGLAILPMGTANALAHDLNLPRDVAGAAKAALRAFPRRVALGRIQYVDFEGKPGMRYFTVTAGLGVDAHLLYKLHAGSKQRLGMAAYYAEAWKLWLTHRMRRFSVEYVETGSGVSRSADVTELMAVRIRNFGGVLRELAPGASLDRDDLRVVLCRTASRTAYLAYVTRGLLRQKWTIPGIDLVYSGRVSCKYLPAPADGKPQQTIYAEADGELLGTLPVEMTIVPDALTLLAPSR